MDRSLRPSGHRVRDKPKPSLHDPGLASSRTTIPAALLPGSLILQSEGTSLNWLRSSSIKVD